MFKSPYEDCNNDNELVQRIAGGDAMAFQVLFERLSGGVYKLCYSLLLDQQMAEDATQETFVKLWKHAAEWKPDAIVKTWLLRVARNHCLDALRKKKNDFKKSHELYKDHLTSSQNRPKNAVETSIDHKKHANIIKNALFALPERQREAITLVYYNEVRNLEAADIMGLQPSAFDSLLARARRTLRDTLGEEQDDLKGYFYGSE